MKNIIIVTAIVFAFNTVYAQKLSTVQTYDMATTIEDSKKTYGASLQITDSLILRDGSVVQIGDTVKCGESSKNTGNDYATIRMGKYSGMKDAAFGQVAVFANPIASVNRVLIIESMKAFRGGGQILCTIYLRDVNVKGFKLQTHLTAFNTSFESGELINLKAPMSREEAITALKESKDLLDLGLMTDEEYNKIKSELTPIIMNK